MTKESKLAILGGDKCIKKEQPHWKWPITSKEKIKIILNYYQQEENIYEKEGYPYVVKRFEKNFAKFQKKKYALALNSGTSTLLAAFFAIGLKPGDEIIAPSLTFYATATPIVSLGAIPVLADCTIDTGNMCPTDLEKKITKRTRAVVITHICGHPCEMDQIIKIIKKHNLFLIEDCSHSHGATYKKKLVGSFSDIACFSLDRNKLISAGEGGVLVTNDKNLFENALIFSDFGPRVQNQIKNKKLKPFLDTGLGHKHRIHPVAAVIADCELKKIKFYIKERKKVLNNFSKKIEKIPGLFPPITKKYVTRGAYFGYRPFVNLKELNNISIQNFIKILQAEGMEVRQAGNKPLHLLKIFSKKKNGPILNRNEKLYFKYKKGQLPNSEKFYNTTISLPTFTFEKKILINSYLKAFRKTCNYLKKNKIKI